MSTSEFDEQLSGKENDLLPFSLQERGLPADFSKEDIAFAQELEGLFSPQNEEVPPYFVQTLLEPEHSRCQIIEQGFEQKTYVHVFRRLKLRRRLFRSSHTRLHFAEGVFPPRRSFMTLAVACLLVALVIVITTGNSFAAGMAELWAGPHSGVFQVSTYPKGLPTHVAQKQVSQRPRHVRFQSESMLSVQQQLSFSMYWPDFLPDRYVFDSLSILNGSDQQWANGPVVQLNYNYSIPGVKSHGTGHIAIREFKPVGQVLQVVKAGAAHQIAIGNNSSGQVAVYVDGQWGQQTKVSQAWVYGVRSELIYEHNGVIFWIVGDQRDGINDALLQSVAVSMTPLNVVRAMHTRTPIDVVVTAEDLTWLFYGDVILGGPNGASLSVLGQPSLSNSLSRERALESMNP